MPVASRLVRWSRVAAIAAALVCGERPAWAIVPPEAMIELSLRGQKIDGSPISWSAREVHLLGRDGRLWTFDPAEVGDFARIAAEFRPYSPSEFRAVLLRELGDGYEVSGTSHYLVAHPRGQGEKWADRFEDLYRSFVHYFSVRGLEPAMPPFPLAGIVCRNRAEIYAAGRRARRRLAQQRVGILQPPVEPNHALRHGRQNRFGQLAPERRRADPRSHAPDGLQHGPEQPLLPAAAVAGRGTGHALRGPRCLRLARATPGPAIG